MKENLLMHSYFAGLFDGEGCITVSKKKKWSKLNLRITCSNNNREVLELMKWCYGGAVRSYSRPWNFRWSASAFLAEDFLMKVYPYLIVKKKRAELALRFRDTIGMSGRPVTQEILEERWDIKNRISQINKPRG